MGLNLSYTLKSQILKVFWITVVFTIIMVYIVLSVYGNLIDLERDVSDLDLQGFIERSIVSGILAGLIGGSAMVFVWEKWLRTKTYGSSLWGILWTYTIIYFVISISASFSEKSSELALPFSHKSVWQSALLEILRIGEPQSYIFWLLVLFGTLIVLLVNDKYGPGVFLDFLMGRYFHPKREERIFMFLDLRSSTTIAEQLGEERYFNFLKDVYRYATPGILNNQGEIYQYVGDEIVISWKMSRGTENANCIRSFFEVQKGLNEMADILSQRIR